MVKRYYVVGYNPFAKNIEDKLTIFTWDDRDKEWEVWTNMKRDFLGYEVVTDEMIEKLKPYVSPTCNIRIEEAYGPDKDVMLKYLEDLKAGKVSPETE